MGEFSPSLKHRLKHSLCGCFKYYNPHQHHPLHNHPFHNDPSPTSFSEQPRLVRSSSGGGASGATMIRTARSDEFNLKDKCRHLISRIGTPRGNPHHRKSKSTDFRYDPLSYSLNFDDDDPHSFEDFPLRNFSSRLPPSPPPLLQSKSDHGVPMVAAPHPSPSQLSTNSPREIAACS